MIYEAWVREDDGRFILAGADTTANGQEQGSVLLPEDADGAIGLMMLIADVYDIGGVDYLETPEQWKTYQ